MPLSSIGPRLDSSAKCVVTFEGTIHHSASDVVQELATTFQREGKELIKLLRELLAQGENEQLRQKAHYLKEAV